MLSDAYCDCVHNVQYIAMMIGCHIASLLLLPNSSIHVSGMQLFCVVSDFDM